MRWVLLFVAIVTLALGSVLIFKASGSHGTGLILPTFGGVLMIAFGVTSVFEMIRTPGVIVISAPLGEDELDELVQHHTN